MADIDLDHLQRLAALRLSEAEAERAYRELEGIIHMIDAMRSIDTEGVAPMANPLDAVQRLRPDVVTETVDREAYQAVAPSVQDGFYLVPRVVE